MSLSGIQINLSKLPHASTIPANWAPPAERVFIPEYLLDARRAETVPAVRGGDDFGNR
jgi:hypothetical protein